MARFITEKRARQNWCSKVQIVVYIDAKGVVWGVTNRGEMGSIEDLLKLTVCVASNCASWVEGPEIEKADGLQDEKIDISTGRVRLVNTGRCGLKR